MISFMHLVKSKGTSCIAWIKILNYVHLKIKSISLRGIQIYFISSETSDVKYIDVGKKRNHNYSCCFKEKSNYFK